MASRTLEITFIGNPRPVQDAFDKVGQSSDGFKGKIEGASGALGGVATVAGGIVAAGAVQQLGGFLIDAGKAAAEDAAATARLEQALRNSSGSFDENLKKVNDRINAGQKLAFSDDDVRDSFQQLLAATGDTDEALRRQSLAMDLSRGAGISLEQASRMVGKVTDDNVQAFKRMGITIQDGASEAEALSAVQAKFAGQSQTYASSTAGQFEQAKIRMGELKEQLGTALLPAFTAFATFMLTRVLPAVEEFADTAGPKIKEFAQNVKRYWESDIKPAVDQLRDIFEKLEPVIRPALEAIGNHIQNVATIVKDVVSLILAIISGDWGRAWDLAKKLVEDFIKLVKEDIEGIAGIIRGAIPLIGEAARSIGSGIKDAIWQGLGDLWSLGADVIRWILQGLKDMAWQVEEWATSFASGLASKLNPKNIISGAAGAVGSVFGQSAGEGGASPLSTGGGMGQPSSSYVDPRGYTYTADEILNMRSNPQPVVINIGTANMTNQSDANRTLTNALRAAGAT